MNFFKHQDSDIPQYIFIGYMTLFVIVFGAIIYFAFISVNYVLIKAFHTRAISQTISTGNEPTIVGIVSANIIENTSTSSPAYLVVKTDRGKTVKVRYSSGKKETCPNYTAAQVGFVLSKGDKIQAYGKATSNDEMTTCTSDKYYIKVLNGTGNKNESNLELDFSISGSIFGHSYKVQIVNQNIEFHEYGRGLFNVIKEVSRPLSDDELESIRTVIDQIDLIGMESQNFKVIPLIPDQALYTINLKYGEDKNTVKCSLHLQGSNPALDCQKSLLKLRDKLGDVLNVKIE